MISIISFISFIKQIAKNIYFFINPFSKINYDFIDACTNGDIEKVKLISNLYKISHNEAILVAIKNKHIEIVRFLLKNPLTYNSDMIIISASEKGYTDLIKILLENPKINPSILNNYPIRCASLYGHIEVVKLLLTDPRVDPSEHNLMCDNGVKYYINEYMYTIIYDNAIINASMIKRMDILKLLLKDYRIDISDKKKFIKWVLKNDNIELNKFILSDEFLDLMK